MRPVSGMLYTRGTLRLLVSSSKLITAPKLAMNQCLPDLLSVGSEHTRNVRLNSHLSSIKETDCCPLTSRTSPVTPSSSIVVTHMSPLDMLGCSIDTMEPVSKIRLLDIPSTSIQQNGNHTHYNITVRGIQVDGDVFIHTSFVSCLSPFFIPSGGLSPAEHNVHVENVCLGSSFLVW
jgi:hypothetical protein